MKRLSIICAFTLVLAFMTSPVFAASYCKDFLETGNPGGWGTSEKSFDEAINASIGETVEIDIWINDAPGAATAGGCFINYQSSTALINITDAQRYNNGDLPGPWSPTGGSNIGPAPGIHMIVVPNLGGVSPDSDGDIIIVKVTFECLAAGVATFTVTTIPGTPTWGPDPPWSDAAIPPNTFTINIGGGGGCDPPDCDDGDACTIDSCVDDLCINEPMDCDDQLWCTNDSCVDGQCINEPKSCGDGDPCTIDSCDEDNDQCIAEPMDCDDGDECTDDSCVDGECIHEEIPGCGDLCEGVDCNDDNACTDDSCDPATGNCINEEIDCDDGNACTDDSCDPATGCVNEVISCDDGDPCTDDSCDQATGCVNTPIDCDDGDPCTDDSCVDGECIHEEIPGCGDPCEGVDCNDDDACTDDSCVDGECINEPINCDDGDECTIDSCDPVDGCIHEQIPGCGEECVTLTVGSADGAPGETGVPVEVGLVNPNDKSRGVQVDICDEGDHLTCTGCEADPTRANSFSCSSNEREDGCCRVVLVSDGALLIDEGTGTIFTISYDVSEDAPGGCKDLTLANAKVSDEFENPLPLCELVPGEFCFALCGDINPSEGPNCGNFVVDILDVLDEIDIALGIIAVPTECQLFKGDVPNGLPLPEGTGCRQPNGEIDIFDILVIIDVVLERPNCCEL